MATSADAAAKPVIMNEEELKRKQREKLKKLQATGGNPRPARSLFFFTLKNPFRKACINIVEWKYPLCPVYGFLLTTLVSSSVQQSEGQDIISQVEKCRNQIRSVLRPLVLKHLLCICQPHVKVEPTAFVFSPGAVSLKFLSRLTEPVLSDLRLRLRS